MDCVLTPVPPFAAVSSPTPSSLSQDDGGFTPSWVSQQEHQLGNLQSTEQTRREIQEMPSSRPPAEDDDEESEFTLNELCCVFPRFLKQQSSFGTCPALTAAEKNLFMSRCLDLSLYNPNFELKRSPGSFAITAVMLSSVPGRVLSSPAPVSCGAPPLDRFQSALQ